MPSVDRDSLGLIVAEELAYAQALDEGLWDDAREGARRLVAAVSKRVAELGVLDRAKGALGAMASMPDGVKLIVASLRDAMQETGESLQLDDRMRAAKELGKLSQDDASDALAADLEGPVHDRAEQLQGEGASLAGLDPLLEDLACDAGRLDEAGLISMVGMGLAAFGGVTMLLQGLAKLAGWLGAERTQGLLQRAHHVLHSVEGKAIDLAIPNALSFAVYNALWKRGFKAQGGKRRALTREEYDAGAGKVREKTEKLMYSGLLLFFAWNGIKAALHAGVGLLGFAEGTASVVKGVEIGRAGGHIADLVQLGMGD